MTICGTGPRYQGRLGISRGYLFVRTGAANSPRAFLPAMPPNTVSGMVTSDQMTRMTTIVPNGSAAVLCRGEQERTQSEIFVMVNRPLFRRPFPTVRRAAGCQQVQYAAAKRAMGTAGVPRWRCQLDPAGRQRTTTSSPGPPKHLYDLDFQVIQGPIYLGPWSRAHPGPLLDREEKLIRNAAHDSNNTRCINPWSE